jgi:Flp pilus assembly protein protease CpaA
MYEMIFLWVLTLIFIIFAVFQDLKTREIANWINFALIIFALGFRFFYSLFARGEFSFFYQGLFGLGVFFVLGNLFYYGHIFAGGDAKLMISLGTILPSSSDFFSNVSIFLNFLLIFLLVGFVYILMASTVLCIRNFKKFKKEFSNLLKKNKVSVIIISITSGISLFLGFFSIIFFVFGIFLFFIYILYLYSKAIDNACMIRKIQSIHLREGDWLYSDLRIGKNIIKSNWNGLSKEEIRQIKNKFKEVKIRQGIPFSPNFLISFIIFIILTILNVKLWNSFW